ncbi:unnamed protein product [Rotaria sp. Silwood2]|nr:unnamed protein product [Rotaria sp. Silwood2]
MPKGKEFPKDLKEMMFRVILFVENEKNGPIIPLYNVNERLRAMFGISDRSISNLRKEMNELQRQEDERESQRSRRRSTTSSPIVQSHRKLTWSSSLPRPSANVPEPLSPKKAGHSGRKSIQLSEYAEDMIRLQFHTILSKREYPTTTKLLACIKSNCPGFPIVSKTTLWRHMKNVDEAAQRFNVEILRLPVRHSVLNLIELAWAGLKNYIRDNNTNFRLVDVHNLTMEYLAAVDGPLSTSYFQHIKTYEDSFKAADKYVQEVVDPTLDENDDEIFDNDSNEDGSVIDSDDLDDDYSSDT